MALTTAQKIALFDILETPYDGSVDVPQGEYSLTGITYQADTTEYKLQTLINNRLSALTSAEENVLVSHINDWLMVGSNITMIDAGSIGGVNGITYDPTLRLQRIQKSVKNLIPVFRYRREIEVGQEGNKVGMNVETFR
jgi:hypothetical protein